MLLHLASVHSLTLTLLGLCRQMFALQIHPCVIDVIATTDDATATASASASAFASPSASAYGSVSASASASGYAYASPSASACASACASAYASACASAHASAYAHGSVSSSADASAYASGVCAADFVLDANANEFNEVWFVFECHAYICDCFFVKHRCLVLLTCASSICVCFSSLFPKQSRNSRG